MTNEEYEELVRSTAVFPKDLGLIYTALGLNGEAGEVAEKVKKVIRDADGIVSDEVRFAILKEVGDVLWYATAVLNEIDATLSEAMDINADKLLSRKARGVLGGSGDDR